MEDWDLDTTIPVVEQGGKTIRSMSNEIDFDLDDTMPLTLADTRPDVAKKAREFQEHPFKTIGKDVLEEVLTVANVIRWPFWRFIEHPLSTVATAVQEPEGKTVGGTLKKAAQAYVPFKRIPKEEYGSYGQIWNNYYKSIMKKDAPDWYVAMASIGTAVAVEPPILKLAEQGGELALTRVATQGEANIIREAFSPLKANLKTKGLDISKLNAEGNIIRLTDDSEIFMNKYVSAVLRGDSIRIPRWAKIKQLPKVATEVSETGKALAPIAPEVLPVTGPEVILTPPPTQAVKVEPKPDLKGKEGIVEPTAKGGGIGIDPIVQEAITNTQGAKVTPEGIELDISRYQKEEQFGAQAIRTGVFYLPEAKSPYGKYYSTGKRGYGGGKKVSGRTTYRNPIIVKAGTGGKGVEKAYDQIEGKGAYQKMRDDVLANAWGKEFNRQPDENAIIVLLEKYGGNPDLAYEIIRTSKKGNQLAYAIQEHIAAHAIRNAGYDAVISHSVSGGKPRLAEVFDLRAEEYPSELSDYKYEDFYPKLSPTEGKVASEPLKPTTVSGAPEEPQVITQDDIGQPPEEPPEFPGVSEEFLKQPKPKTTILQYFTPAEYHLKQLGFDAKIGQPVREALRDFSIELMQKNEKLINIQKKHFSQLKGKEAIKASNDKLWELMDKGIPKGDKSIEAKIAKELRPETEEMLKRINELNKRIDREEVKGIKNYILHMLKPEILNEIYSKGVIPPELAKVMEYIPPKNVFLRTAQQRKGIPDEWLVKDPYELMRAMYAIDLRYIYLQDALNKIEPYLKAVKNYHGEGLDYWTPETYKYLDDWIKQAIKMRPSNWDALIDNMLEYTFAPLLRKAGIKVSHMPWRDLVSTLSAGAHTGALGLRIKPLLRNLVQSTFDWVFYGTKPYLKGSAKFMTKEGFDILRQSKTWKTRMPLEAQDVATLQKIFKAGSIGYRWSDLHNVGKGLLTRYYHAVDDLKMTHEEAIKWADDDLPATQWSYRREDLPRAYWTTTGRAFWTLGSWWMNFYTRFLPELTRRAFTGKDVLGRVVPSSERLGIMRLFILIGLLFALKESSKELFGTTVDYTGQIKPTPLRNAPIAALGAAFIKIAQGITDENNMTLNEGMKELSNTAKIFIPFYLAGQDLFDVLSGKKKLNDVLFYTGRKKTGKVR